MNRFSIFVDGSNLFGSLKKLNLQVTNYESFYHHIFTEGLKMWQTGTALTNPAHLSSSLLRTFWYVLGSIDYIDTNDAKLQAFFKELFDNDREIKRAYMALAGQANPGKPQNEVALEAWRICFEECKTYFWKKKTQLDGMKKFYHGVRSDTDFIDIIECGHWKVDFLYKYVAEKGLDTQLAVDIVTQVNFYDVALIISGDADSIPSVNYIKRLGKQVGVVEFIKGYPPEKRGKQFSNRLGAASDFVVQIYEMDLQKNKIAQPLKAGEDVIPDIP